METSALTDNELIGLGVVIGVFAALLLYGLVMFVINVVDLIRLSFEEFLDDIVDPEDDDEFDVLPSTGVGAVQLTRALAAQLQRGSDR